MHFFVIDNSNYIATITSKLIIWQKILGDIKRKHLDSRQLFIKASLFN